ncbi:MAG: WecB/TagA/CpsF family glycosyltransferase [Alphaproteobacteria bacterium]|nr:WecB/TagA/CpsF family glycosyltransferase [Alphaproteobacteria bacterium]
MARLTQAQAIQELLAHVPDGPALRVAFANAHGLLLAMDDPKFAQTLDGFLVLNDGIGAEIGARLLTGEGFPDNLNGTDFVPALLAAAPSGTRVYLLGAKPEIVARAAEEFAAAYPGIVICGHRDGYFGPDAHAEIVTGINAAAPDILLVAIGNPKQEHLIRDAGPALDVPLMLGSAHSTSPPARSRVYGHAQIRAGMGLSFPAGAETSRRTLHAGHHYAICGRSAACGFRPASPAASPLLIPTDLT